MVVVLGTGMLKPLLRISRFFMEINQILSSVRHISPILALNSVDSIKHTDINEPIAISFHHVNFSYREKLVLHDVHLSLDAGSNNIVVGSSGAGKSTIAHLLTGLLLPDSGDINLNNVALWELNYAQKSTLIALVSQDVFLFKGSILDNIILGNPQATTQQITLALQTAQLDECIQTLEKGVNTLIDEQGVRLSGGEKQRITIARALLADTPLLILDEVTSSLDNVTQANFFRSLRNNYPDKTTLCISHNLYGVESVDQIIIILDGTIADSGTHDELLARNHFYQASWQCQQQGEQWSIANIDVSNKGDLHE